MSRVFRSERQDGLPGLGKVRKPSPVVGNHRKVTREGVIKVENVFPAGGV